MALKHVLLTVLAENDATGYEITKEFDEVLGYFWHATHQQVYRELAALEEDGWVRHRVVPQAGKPDRKVYTLTASGKQALLEWLATPLTPKRVNDELMVKLLGGTLMGVSVLKQEMKLQRDYHQQRLDTYRAIEKEHYSASARAKMPKSLRLVYLTLRRGIHSEKAWLAWADEVEEALESL